MYTSELFIGITSWNSELFLGHCLKSIFSTTSGISKRVVVLDNHSSDNTVAIAKKYKVEVIVRACKQGDALNNLINLSRSKYTLLLHADVVLLSENWFKLCGQKMQENIALVSPEDIGCGPLTRPFGKDKPESSFLFFDTEKLKKIKTIFWQNKQKFFFNLPQRKVDFYGPHITHHLPQRLSKKGYTWQPMQVHYSDTMDRPIYQPNFVPQVWSPELEMLRYGLGNFYSLDGIITHYHNWYDRVRRDIEPDSKETTAANGQGFPLAYIQAYTESFLQDYQTNQLVVPNNPVTYTREPKQL